MRRKTDGAATAKKVRPAHHVSTRSNAEELDYAVQRYADLYDLAPTGYVSFDGSGGIVEINLAAAQLLGMPRERLIGTPFTVFVSREDNPLFLAHLLRCRCSDMQVETEIRLKNVRREIIHAYLSSTPTAASVHNGAVLYQTAIIDLTDHKRAEEARSKALRQQAALYELSQRHQEAKTLDEIYEAALDAILTALPCDRASILLYDQQQMMRFVAWRGLSGKYRRAVEAHSPWKPDAKNPQPVCVADVDLADIPKSLKSTIRNEGIRAVAFIPLVSSGRLIGKFMIYHSAPHLFTDNELKLATTIARQLVQAIQHKRDEEALRESEARMRATVEQATAGVLRYDRHARFIFVNRTFCQMLGYRQSELLGESIADVTHRDDVKKHMRLFRRLIQDGKPFELEKRYVRKDGSVLWADVSTSAVRGRDGKTQSAIAVVVDITARKKAEVALKKSKEMLEQLVEQRTKALSVANAELKNEISRRKGLEGEILAISDREQQRLGQELHDGLCQHLTAVAFMARSIALRLKNHRVIDASDIEKIAELVNDAATDTRNLSRALHRFDVDAVGLVDALQDLVDREIWKIPCRLEVNQSFHIEDDAAAAQLYRIAREAVINANKHAQAREILVQLERSRQEMVLRVTDDGVGFKREPKLKQGLGVHIMNYRAQSIGGRLEIDSPKRGGTCVSCYLPDRAFQPRKRNKKENGRQTRFPAKITNALVALI
jgi:PAS domain S-box-containing protein